MNLDEIGQSFVDELKKNLIRDGKVSSGRLLNSLSYKIILKIEGVTFQILGEKYLQFVDQGRRPGKMPPIQAIESWVKQKPVRFIGKSDKQTAFLIARSIGRKGIVPTNIIKKSIDNILNNLSQSINLENTI